jgi:hypothetical protein
MKKIFIPTLALLIGITTLTSTHAMAANTASAAEIIAKADTAITTRITTLTKLSASIAKFKHLTSDQQSSLNAKVQSAITAMTTLKAKIDGETDITVLKTDYASITNDYRIYMLVMPSITSIAAADNAMETITIDQATLTTLNTRIIAAQAAGKNVTDVTVAYTDASVKLADAQTQGQSMISAVTSLRPDMGNKTVESSNNAALANGKADRKLMTADLSVIKKDIVTIRTELKSLKA